MGYPTDKNGEACSAFHTGEENDHRHATIPMIGCHCTYCDKLRFDGKKNFAELSQHEIKRRDHLIKDFLARKLADVDAKIAAMEQDHAAAGELIAEAAAAHDGAATFLRRATEAIEARGVVRDQPTGERSMARTVAMFNALMSNDTPDTMTKGANELSELDGWRFMICLKLARSVGGQFNPDDYIDMAGYAALAGECAARK